MSVLVIMVMIVVVIVSTMRITNRTTRALSHRSSGPQTFHDNDDKAHDNNSHKKFFDHAEHSGKCPCFPPSYRIDDTSPMQNAISNVIQHRVNAPSVNDTTTNNPG